MQTTATSPKTASVVSDILLSKSWTDDYLEIIFNFVLRQLFPYEGLLLLDRAGQLVQSNPKARELCHFVQQGLTSHEAEESVRYVDVTVPRQIAQHYEPLITELLDFSEQSFQLTEEICLETDLRIRLNVERISLEGLDSPYLLVRLEDITQTAIQRACWDAHRYHLTHRESEVWALFLQGLSYQDIAGQLFISKDTVSKHMKRVYSKRRGEG